MKSKNYKHLKCLHQNLNFSLQSFLSFYRGLSLPVTDDLSQESHDATQSLHLAKLVYALTENIIVDFPSFTSKISSLLCRLTSRRHADNALTSLPTYHVIASVAFFAQVRIRMLGPSAQSRAPNCKKT